VGEDGATHQGAFDISYLGTIPNMIISAPKDENELQNLIYTAVKGGRPCQCGIREDKEKELKLNRICS
jgi:1-deoxy-D-xylulose-5-phosphate synthase